MILSQLVTVDADVRRSSRHLQGDSCRTDRAMQSTKNVEQDMPSQLIRCAFAITITALVVVPVHATNGMNLEAYGAMAGGMGGASFAYDNGNAAMMNNPATLGLRKQSSNFGLGLTALIPDVKTTMPSPAGPVTVESDGNLYLMPNLSFIKKSGEFTYGAGLYAQGGMGSEWGASLSGGSGLEQRSEVGFGRLMFPLAYNVNDALTVAAQLEYVWASLDLKMINPVTGDYYSFSNNSDFTGEATGSGWAYKLGAHYRLNNEFAIGATYHSRTDIEDLEGSGYLNSPNNPAQYKVVDPQWPETYGVGMAWNTTDKFMLATDIKIIHWSNSLDTFRIKVNGSPAFGLNGSPQNWDDQTIYMIGGQYTVSSGVALRAGYNYASNPVPDVTLNPLAPAIISSHYTFGVGWKAGGGHNLASSFTYSPEVEQTNPNLFGPGVAGQVSHSQMTLRVDYDYSF
jgi:long-chain fatty acid transport protein